MHRNGRISGRRNVVILLVLQSGSRLNTESSENGSSNFPEAPSPWSTFTGAYSDLEIPEADRLDSYATWRNNCAHRPPCIGGWTAFSFVRSGRRMIPAASLSPVQNRLKTSSLIAGLIQGDASIAARTRLSYWQTTSSVTCSKPGRGRPGRVVGAGRKRFT